MKRFSIIIFILLGLMIQTNALDLNGYFEYRYSMFNMEKTENSNMNKFRFDFKFDKGKKVTLNGDFIIETYNGFNEFEIMNFLPEYTYSEIEWYLLFIPDTFELEDRSYLDNGYISIYTKYFNLRLGKQQLNWGVGYFWRPTDLFNTRDIIEPEYEKEGVNAVKFEILFTGFWSLELTYLPSDNFELSDKAVRLKGELLGFDIELFKIDTWQDTFKEFPISMQEKKVVFGGTLNGELFSIGSWLEYGFHSIHKFEKGYSTYVLGFDYTFEFQTYIMGEYFRNDEAIQDTTEYSVVDWLDYISEFRTTLGPEYAAMVIMQPLGDLMELSVSGITNLHDESVLLSFDYIYNFEENVELELIYVTGFGEKDTEFKLVPETMFAYFRFYF